MFLLIYSFYNSVYRYIHYISWKVPSTITITSGYVLQKTFSTIQSIGINNDLSTQTQCPYLRLVLICKIEFQKSHFLYLKLILAVRSHKLKPWANSNSK